MQSFDDLGNGPLGAIVSDTVDLAAGRRHRVDPVLPRTGGPAGNALLVAWTALVLLVVSVAELLTLFDVRGLISWHVAIGALLVPPALVKTGGTVWRFARYYAGDASYREAGPPPMLLRLLGPFVIISTIGLLASGVLLVLLGPDSSHASLVDLMGFRVDWVSVHQAFFAVWAVATGLHVLGRLVPALRTTVPTGDRAVVPGALARWVLMAAMTASAVALAVTLVHADTSWTAFHPFGFEHDD